MIKDSGDRTQFDTGAVRDMHTGKGRMDLLPVTAIIELSKHCEAGALKYGERNVDKGIPQHSFIDSGLRHLFKYLRGDRDENHLVAALWNIAFAVEQEYQKPNLQDIPSRQCIEIWKDTKFENYEVSSLGRIRNKKTGKIHTGCPNDKGYVYVSLYVNGKSKSVRLHRLVAEAFLPNPKELQEVNHINGNKKDNTVYNLEWVTHQENIEHSMKTGLCKGGIRKVTDEQIRYIRKYCKKGKKGKGIRAVARDLGLSHTTVKDIVNNKRWAVEQDVNKPELNDLPSWKEGSEENG